MVYPSGLALLRVEIATAPPDPGLLINTIFCPRAFSIWGVIVRTNTSVVPPADSGKYTVIGLDG